MTVVETHCFVKLILMLKSQVHVSNDAHNRNKQKQQVPNGHKEFYNCSSLHIFIFCSFCTCTVSHVLPYLTASSTVQMSDSTCYKTKIFIFNEEHASKETCKLLYQFDEFWTNLCYYSSKR